MFLITRKYFCEKRRGGVIILRYSATICWGCKKPECVIYYEFCQIMKYNQITTVLCNKKVQFPITSNFTVPIPFYKY